MMYCAHGGGVALARPVEFSVGVRHIEFDGRQELREWVCSVHAKVDLRIDDEQDALLGITHMGLFLFTPLLF